MKFALIVFTIAVIVILAVYAIKFNYDGYDILLHNRLTGLGFGIDYKKDFGISIFTKTIHGGMAERHFYFDGFMHVKEGYK